jgi:hypothetical protein
VARSPRGESARIARERTLSKDQKHVFESEVEGVGAVLQYDLTEPTQGLAVFAGGDGGIYQPLLRFVQRARRRGARQPPRGNQCCAIR